MNQHSSIISDRPGRIGLFLCGLGLSLAAMASPGLPQLASDAAFLPASQPAAVHLATTPPTAAPSTQPPRLAAGYGRLPMSFEPNQGQAAQDIQYLARGQGYLLGLTDQAAILSLHPSAPRARPGDTAVPREKAFTPRITPNATPSAALRFSLAGARKQVAMVAEAPQQSRSNYFIGNDPSKWHRGIPNYGAVRYEQAYPGIDWVVYGNPQQLEYDLVVAPQADPKQIRLKIEGADSLALDDNGDLLVKVKDQTIRQLKPMVYQTAADGSRQTVEGHYRLDHRQVAFALADYDHSRQLVIDPVLGYSTYLGGSGSDVPLGIAVDGAGNAYIAGSTYSTNFPTASPLQGTYGGTADGQGSEVFVSKLSADGSALVYSTYLGGNGNEGANGIAVDSAGDAYVAGFTNSTNFPTANPVQASLAGDEDNAFVTKLDAAGSALVYSTYLGGSNGGFANAIAVDSSGSAYVAGYTYSTDFPTVNPIQAAKAAGYDVFVTKFNAAGSALVYSTYLGGSQDDVANGIAADSAGNAYVAGYTNSTDFPTSGAVQGSNMSGGQEAFVAELNAAGSALVYSTYLGGSAGANANAIAVDSTGSAYVAGYTYSTDFPTASPLQSAKAGSYDGFVTKFNAAGSALVYSTYLGGSGYDIASGIAVDTNGSAYVTGYTQSTDFPTANPLQATFAGVYDAFVTKLNAAGSALVYSTYLGGSDSDQAYAIALNGGSAYIVGATESTNFPTVNPLQAANAGSDDAFISKINGDLPPAPTGLTATACNTQASLNWIASSAATSYNAYQGTSSNGESATPVQTGLTSTSATVAGLSNGTTYYFKVAAVNGNGTSLLSAEASATAPLPPGQVTGLKATPGGDQITLKWSLTAGATAYNIYESSPGVITNATRPHAKPQGSGLIPPIASGVTGTSYVVTGLTIGGTYAFQVEATNCSGSGPLSAEVSAYPLAATPTFNPKPGTYTSEQFVTISDTSSDATIYYTLDGTTPTTASKPYSIPFSVAEPATIKAIATASGYGTSAVGTGKYTIAAAKPMFTPTAGHYTTAQSVTISDATNDAAIYYTTDGSTPTTASTPYTGPISINQITTLKAIAAETGLANSAVATGAYTITDTTPTFSPKTGKYIGAQSVTISDATNEATIYYTTDGSTPTLSSTLYTGPINVAATTTIKAIAAETGLANSAVATATYTIH